MKFNKFFPYLILNYIVFYFYFWLRFSKKKDFSLAIISMIVFIFIIFFVTIVHQKF